MEVLVVLTIIILVAGFSLFVSLDSYRGNSFRSERDTAIAVLQKARSQAMSNICFGTCTDGKAHGVHFTSTQYIIFQGNSFTAGDATNQVIPINNSVTFSPAPPFDIIFNQLDGTVTAPVSFTISDPANHSAQININAEGRIDNP